MNDMQAIDIARRMAELGQEKESCQAYALAIADTEDPGIQFEAALYILQNGGNYKVSYDVLLKLTRNPDYQQEAFRIITEAFYSPNEKQLKTRYEKNCKLLQKYPYLFRKDFPKFEDLPIRFYPFDDTLYVPYNMQDQLFQEKINFNYPKISHYFFKDLSKPILAENIFSQYELEYLRDNVRKSEWVAKENHIYLHYSKWEHFCAYLQVLNLRNLLGSKKFVFLIEDEATLYPIDFKKKFGIDYSQNNIEPFHLNEFQKLIWHTQLATHNGGDFFNEIFDAHPNVIVMPSMMMSNITEQLQIIRDHIDDIDSLCLEENNKDERTIKQKIFAKIDPVSLREERNLFVFFFLYISPLRYLDLTSRITPAIFFQPHFPNVLYNLEVNDFRHIILESEQYNEIKEFPAFNCFPYIKVFTPMRRPTNSAAATARFQYDRIMNEHKSLNTTEQCATLLDDNTLLRVLNRSYMIDWQDKLFQDSILVRFEDGKLNPKATFTSLSQFLDIPYANSLTYCSENGVKNAETFPGNAIGFSTKAIYSTYDEYLGTPERVLLEFSLRDAYRYYGYAFEYYDGKSMNIEMIKNYLNNYDLTNELMWKTFRNVLLTEIKKQRENNNINKICIDGIFITEDNMENYKEHYMNELYAHRLDILTVFLDKVIFVNKSGQPLQFMPLLKLDPDLLEQPLYH